MRRADGSWPDIAGKIEGHNHILPLRVYYEDTDFSGAVYHANYLKFCERARSDYLRLLGVHHHLLQGQAGFMVRHLTCDFLAPAGIDDLLIVSTKFISAQGARLRLEQKINCADKLLFQAEILVAFVDDKGRPKRLSPVMCQLFAQATGF